MACNCGICQSCNYFETGLSRGYDELDEQEGVDDMNELIETPEGIRQDLTSTRVKHTDRTESALVHITKAVELLKEEVVLSEEQNGSELRIKGLVALIKMVQEE